MCTAYAFAECGHDEDVEVTVRIGPHHFTSRSESRQNFQGDFDKEEDDEEEELSAEDIHSNDLGL